MRCLGRLVFLFVLLIAAGVAWLYRDDLRRWVDVKLHPASAVARVGHPSPGSLKSATAKLDQLQRNRPDSVVLNASELASLVTHAGSLLPGVAFDSLTLELGDRTVHIRAMVDSTAIPPAIRMFIPGGPRRFEELILSGTLTPVRAGLAELDVEHVTLQGIPLPSELLARLANATSGKATGSRLDVVLPETVGGFRVRPEGVAIYRGGAPR